MSNSRHMWPAGSGKRLQSLRKFGVALGFVLVLAGVLEGCEARESEESWQGRDNDDPAVRRQHLWNRFSSGLKECFCSS